MDSVKERVLAPGKAGLKNLAGKTLAQMQRYNFYLHKMFFLPVIILILANWNYVNVNQKNTHAITHYADRNPSFSSSFKKKRMHYSLIIV